MSESPEYVPPFVRASRTSGLLGASRVEPDDLDADLDDDGDAGEAHDHRRERPDVGATPARVREGLPPTYRMRAEPHYVEALVDRALTLAEPAVSVPPASPLVGLAAATALPPHPNEIPAAPALLAAAVALSESFEAIQAALRDVPMRGRPLRDRVAIELARAEATRGRWLADASLALQIEPLPALDEVDVAILLAEVLNAFGPENRLAAGAAALAAPREPCVVFGDAGLLTTALGAMLAAVRMLIEDRGDPRKLQVALGPRQEAATRTLEISQMAVRVPSSAYARFFDPTWDEHPAGATGALLLAAARKIATSHGGLLEVDPLALGGCRLVLSLPAAD